MNPESVPPNADLPREPGRLLVGTSGYVFDDWVGPFYPRGLARRDWLSFYAAEFGAVEVNATYYRIPPPRTLAAMEARTPPGFRFVVKANRAMTHEASRDPDVYGRFLDCLAPLEEAGKLDGVLLQFPWGMRNTAVNRAHLGFLRERLGERRAWAEFRHDSWNTEPVYGFLRSLDLGFCAVDEPALPGLFPPVCRATTGAGYVRFHGRNAETWWGGGHERYDWTYTADELSGWVDKLRALTRETGTTHVFFNNCYMGRAVRGARLLQQLLGLDGKPELDLGV